MRSREAYFGAPCRSNSMIRRGTNLECAPFRKPKEAVARIYKLIKSEIPNAKIIFTLSPIPLVATFRDESCIVANAASKSILRAALDEFIRIDLNGADPDLYYFPAFEIISELFPARFLDDGRHLQPFIVPAVMKLFEAHFCETDFGLQAESGKKHQTGSQNECRFLQGRYSLPISKSSRLRKIQLFKSVIWGRCSGSQVGQ